ncbi:MAG: DUF4382 domain-containing protein [Longimicrobiales bacterium]
MRTLYRSGAVVAVCLLFLGCGDGATSSGSARLDVFLTDAPGDVSNVWVQIGAVYFQGTGGRSDVLTDPTELIELTSLVGTSLQLVQAAELSPGSYSQLRFVIDAAVLETKGGEVYQFGGAEHPDGDPVTGALQCPSCSTSGLKVVLGPAGLTLAEGENVLMLDFDVAQSFGHQAGGSGGWVMHPVIHGTEVEGGTPASISGTVVSGVTIPECPAGAPRSAGDFIPTATAASMTDDDGNPVLRTGTVQPDGTFTIGFVQPDDYSMSAVTALGLGAFSLNFEATVVPAEVTVAQGSTVAGVAYSITSATCLPAS